MKFGIAFILAAVMFAPVVHAKTVTKPVFEDFSTFTSIAEGTSEAINFCDSFIELRQNGGRITADTASDNKYGISMKLTSVQSSNGAAVNPKFGISGSSVYGLSVYLTGDDSTLRLAGKYKKSSGTAWLSQNPIEMKDSKIYVFGSEMGTFAKNTWYDIRLAMRFDTHQYDVYINGVKINPSPISFSSDAVGMDYFNINAAQAKSANESAEYIDNMTAYGSCCGDFTVSTNLDGELDAVNPKTTDKITLNFDREMLPGVNLEDIVALQTEDGADVDGVTLTPVIWGGYIKGAEISLGSGIAPNTSYKITLSGAEDLNGNSLSDEITFTTIDDRPVLSVSMDSEFNEIPENVKVKFNLVKKNFDEFSDLKFYCNNELIGKADASAENFTALISGGENEVYAVASGAGGELVSNTVIVTGITYNVNEEVFSNNFDGTNPLSSFSSSGSGAGELNVELIDNEYKNSLKFLGKKSQNDSTNTYVNTQTFNGKTGINMIEGDFRWDKLASTTQAMPNFKVKTNENKEIFFAPITINSSGSMILTYGSSQTITLIEQIDTTGKWYNIRIYFDSINKDITVIIDNELKAYRLSLSNQNVTDIAYLHLSVGGFSEDFETLFFLDNLKINKVSTQCSVTSPQSDSVISYDAGTAVELNFTEPMNIDMLSAENIILKSADGNSIGYVPSFSGDGKTYTITLQEALIPDKEYTIEFTDKVKSANGGKLAEGSTVSFTTQKVPFGLNSYQLKRGNSVLGDISDVNSGDEITININVRNRNNENKTVKLAAGWYTASNKLAGFNTVTVTSTTDGIVFPITMTAPDDVSDIQYELHIFLLDNFTDLTTEDFIK